MSPVHQLSWNLFLATDASQYSSGDNRRQLHFQADLINGLTSAADAAGLCRSAWTTQAEGDGELALLPPEEPVTVVMDDFIHHLNLWLADRNRDRVPAARLRLRVSMHLGSSEKGANGFAGQAPIVVKRLLNSRQAHQALDVADEADLALIVSRQLFDDVVSHRYGSLRPENFVEVQVHNEAKRFADTAWISVPGLTAGELSTRMAAPTAVTDISDQEQPRLILVLRSEYDHRVLADLVRSALADEPHTITPVDGCLAIIPGSSVAKDRVVGVWIDKFSSVFRERTCAAVAVDDQHQAAALAEVPLAHETLAATAGRVVAVVVSDQAYQWAVAPGGRKVAPETYRRFETANGAAWIRIPGYSVPPKPHASAPAEPTQRPHEQGNRMQLNIGQNNAIMQHIGDRTYYGGRHDHD